MKFGTKKAYNRWDTCVNLLYFKMRPALESLYAQKYRNKELEESAEILAREAVEDFINIFSESKFDYFHTLVVANRLRSMKIIFGAPEEVLNGETIEKFYDELELNGNENYFKTWNEIQKHYVKMTYEGFRSKQSWKQRLDKITLKHKLEYDENENFFCKNHFKELIYRIVLIFFVVIPAMLLRYPFFHPERPRFFNMATFFAETINTLNTEVVDYLQLTWGLWNADFPFLKSGDQLAYDNYVRWEESGGKELQLSGNRLTNRQLFWVARARFHSVKFHPDATGTDTSLLEQYERFFCIIKTEDRFQEAFKCKTTNESSSEIYC